MKNIFYLLIAILSISATQAQQFPTFDWARVASEGYPTIPSVGNSYSSDIRIIKRDVAGNIYISGQINKAMKFANQNIYAQDFNGSIYGYYLMKLNPTGETMFWVKTLIYADISDFEIDTDGFIYATSTGSGGGTIKYGNATIAGGDAYPSVMGGAIYYKIDASNGNMVWMKNMNGAIGASIYPFIETNNDAIFTTDILGPNANHSTTNRGYRLVKILKSLINASPANSIDARTWILDKTWFRTNVDPLFENFILDMKLTNDKQSLWLYLKTGDAWIDDFSNQLYDTRDMIVVRLDNINTATPTVGFKKKFTTIVCPDQGQLAIDNQGNVLLTGSFITNPTRYTQNANGNANLIFGGVTYEFPMNIHKQFIAKLSPTGTETWIKFFDQQPGYLFRSLTLDANDNIYVAGGSIPSRPTIGSFTSVNDPWWIMKMKSDGDQVYMWSNEEGGSNNSEPFLFGYNDGVLVGVNGGGGKFGTKEIVYQSSFVLTNLRHSGTAKPFEELKMLKNINTGGDVLSNYSSHPNNFMELGGGLVFFAWGGSDLNNAGYLWKTDGTENGTTILKEIYNQNYESGSFPYSGQLVKIPTHLYFEGQSKVPNTNTYQREIWKSDGTVAGTVKIKSFLGGNIGDGGSKESAYDIRSMVYCNGLVFFTMTDNVNTKIDLWKTDGTEAGTVRVLESVQPELLSFNNFVYYFIVGAPDGFGNVQYTMRRTNGTGSSFVKNMAATNVANIPRFFGVVNNQILFVADGSIIVNSNTVNSGMELWKSDGTQAGTVIVKDINPEVSNNFPPGPFSAGKSSISYANEHSGYLSGWGYNLSALSKRSIIDNNILYFNANDGVNGKELWKSDGTSAGTVLIKDFLPGSSPDIWGTIIPNGSDPISLYPYNGNIYMIGYDGFGERGLIKTDGTSSGTVLVKSSIISDAYMGSSPYKLPFAVLSNNLYFAGKEQPNSLKNQYNEPLTNPYFNEIWSTDGTTEGTKQLKNLAKGGLSFNPINMYAWNGSLYFTAHRKVSDNIFIEPIEAEPWKFTPAVCTTPAPAGPLSENPTILRSYPATIKSNGCLGIVKWYATSTSTPAIFTGDNYTTPLLNATTDYYLSCTFNNCESQRTKAIVTVNTPVCTTLPSPPSSSGSSVVSGNSITLSAVGCTEQTRWYGQSTGGAILAQTPTFTTPVLTTPTTYYPVCFVLGCESNRTVLDNITITPSSGQALDFDGTDDAVIVPANAGFNAQSFTMETWVRFDANNRSQTIMDNSQRWMYYNYVTGGNSIKFGFAENGNPRQVGFTFTPTAGTWYHLACTYNNTTKECSFYQDGQLQDIQTTGNYNPNQSNFGMSVGTGYTSGNYLDGRIEEARFWNITRTETQIGASYNTELSGNETGLVFYYKFDVSATNVQDCSPNLLHGVRSGATGVNDKPQYYNTSVALTDVACGVSTSCTIATAVSVGSNSPICAGNTLNLIASGGISYAWTGLSFTSTTQNPSRTNTTTAFSGTYMVTITDENACTATATTSVIVNPKPTPNAGADVTICVGNSTTIGSTNVVGNSYSWSPTIGLSSTIISNPIASPTITTNYVVTMTSTATGCSATDDVVVIVNQNPAPSASGVTITSGSTASITATGCTTYKWYNLSTAGTLLFTGNPFISPALNTNTTYYVACSDAPCPSSSRMAVLVTVSSCTLMYTLKTGIWNDPTVWSCNRIPIFTDNITVEFGHIVSVPAGTFQVKKVTEKGTLSFLPSGVLNIVGGL